MKFLSFLVLLITIPATSAFASRMMDLDRGVQIDSDDLDNGFYIKKGGKIVKCKHADDLDLSQLEPYIEKLSPGEIVGYSDDFRMTQLPPFHPERFWKGYCGSW